MAVQLENLGLSYESKGKKDMRDKFKPEPYETLA